MKRLIGLLAIVFLFLAGPVWAEPYLVCDPQTDADGYVYSLNGGPEVEVAYEERVFDEVGQKAVIADLASIPEGPFTYEVRAYLNDPVWGRLESATVPFESARPASGSAPAGLRLAR